MERSFHSDVCSCFVPIVTCTMFMQTGDDAEDDVDAGEEFDSEKKEKMRELISQKLKREKGAERTSEATEEERGKKSSRRFDCMSSIKLICSRKTKL